MRLSSIAGAALMMCMIALPIHARAQAEVLPSFKEDASAIPDAPEPQKEIPTNSLSSGANLSGTVLDAYGDVLPGARVVVESSDGAFRSSQFANEDGFFQFKDVRPNLEFRVSVSSRGFDDWASPPITLKEGQFFEVIGIKLRLHVEAASVNVTATTEQVATEQVTLAEHQRVFGFIPNFYVMYESEKAVPLTVNLKFRMATRVAVDPVSFLGSTTLAAINQAADIPDFDQGWKGYAQRFGTSYADGVTNIMFGGAILPALLHQDPRYFYLGRGSIKSRTLHALSNPFICRGDNGSKHLNISSMGGDLISGVVGNAYYPDSDKGLSRVLNGFLISTMQRETVSLLQEFVIRRFTPRPNN